MMLLRGEPPDPLKGKPLGAGRELAETRGELVLPVERVRNKVLWVNPAFEGHLPFNLATGKETNLGLFLSPEGKLSLSIMPEYVYGRSVGLERIVIEDSEGNLYLDVDLKGVGLFTREDGKKFDGIQDNYIISPIFSLPREGVPRPEEMLGIVHWDYAANDKYKAEALWRMGVGTYRVAAIIQLEEVIIVKQEKQGDQALVNKISIEEAKKEGYIHPKAIPVIEVRVYPGTRERVGGVVFPVDKYLPHPPPERDLRRIIAILKDAQILTKSASMTEYLTNFARRLGENLGRLHRGNCCHRFVTPHNVTLTGELVDLDSVFLMLFHSRQERIKKFFEDMKSGEIVICNLMYAIRNLMRNGVLKVEGVGMDSDSQAMEKEILNEYYKAYQKKVGDDLFEEMRQTFV